MSKVFVNAKRWCLIAAVCISACAMTGCIESTFNLATESRLPQGIAIPPGLSRDDVSVTLDFVGISQARFTVRDKAGKKLKTVRGKTKGSPIYLKTDPKGPYPRSPGYDLVVINGVTEILECTPYTDLKNNFIQKSLFYVIDDPDIREEILAVRRMK